ncbi:hypothetical protein [Natronococcus occultus]|uniref:C2H2-type domain-containing protein n=1 Tax=Natronococcus occultus SP4 TaxID=694430 RepID=L0JYC9_9EURY|nr:hypothetical protein [Natronococcus occultus]AGB38062.1 hypothetical protein Natoc_2284 [Natronococcus occultus SP4]
MNDSNTVLFRCTECDHTTTDVASLHAHCEKHRGYTRFGIQIPFTRTSAGDFNALMEYTDVLRVEDTTKISLKDIDRLTDESGGEDE